jgi:O-acetyl-ADP-ribose deacetylase (regulator of RNase III)
MSPQQRVYSFNNSLLIVKFSDIVEAKTDVLVNSDDYGIPMQDGLSGYILEKGGQDVLNDIEKKRDAELGDVVVTTAGKLPHKCIFHCVTVSPETRFKSVSEEGQQSMQAEMEESVIRHSLTKCFRLLSAMDYNSIALPCIGSRRSGFTFQRIGAIMSEVISAFLLRTNKSYRVELCLHKLPENLGLMDYICFFEQFSLKVPSDANVPIVSKNTAPTVDEEGNQPEFDVFISYSHQDYEIAEKICSLLDSYCISYWIDHGSERHSDDFKEEIVSAILRSKILLYISSVNSNKSRNTVKEVSVAENNNKVILPVKVDGAAYNKSLEYDLCNRHWLQLKNLDYEALGREINDNVRFFLNRTEV